LVNAGDVVDVVDEELGAVGEVAEGDTARTIRKVEPMNSTTMINTTLNEG
jgi:hypothetical protein